MFRWVLRSSAAIATLLCVLFLVSTSAWADTFDIVRYGGNNRYPANGSTGAGYGVKADIWTPSQLELISRGLAFSRVSTYDSTFGGKRWVQAGWVQGDGILPMGNSGIIPPNYPSSFLEVCKADSDSYYHFELFSAQQLNSSRFYKLENTSNQHWLITIVNQARYPEYSPFANNTSHLG